MKKFFIGVKGIIVQDKRILLVERNSTPSFWEVPGGRISGEEGLHEALSRELHEELPGITNLSIGEQLGACKESVSLKDDMGPCFISV